MDNQRQTRSTHKIESILTIAALLVILSGCRSGLDVSKLRSAEKSRFEVEDEEAEKKGMFSRMGDSISSVSLASFRKSSDNTSAEPLPTAQGYKELEVAKALSKSGKYGKAEREFKRISKKYANSSVGEDALFFRAESFYNRKRYSYAQDAYTQLLKAYPSTRYMRKSTQRLFSLSQKWLGFSEIATSGDIQPINFEDIKATKPVKHSEPSPKGFTRTVPILPNLFDKTRPVFDTEGRALEALKSIWLNDPTGPLADDALMLSASYYLRKEDYLEADHFLTILREEYPKSPHLEIAFQLGSHVKMMSYQGPAYEGNSLEESKRLMESTLRIFPEIANRERTLDDIRKVEHAHAEQQWQWVTYYQKKKRPQSVAVYCNVILEDYPHSAFATKAQQILNQMESDQLTQNTTKKKRRLQFLRRKKKGKNVPDFEDDIDPLKKVDSPSRLKRILPRFTKRKKKDESSEPDFMDSDDEIPNYNDPQFIDDDEPDFEDEKAPGRLELEPGEDSDFIDLDEPAFDE